MLTYHRFNWMGNDKAESASTAAASLRENCDFKEGSLRNRDYQRRRQVASLIRERLDRIKSELGLLPPETAASPIESTVDLSAVSQPTQPDITPEKMKSARDLMTSIRTALVGQGNFLVSHFDGSAHRDIVTLREFNASFREEMIKTELLLKLDVAPEEAFSTEELEVAAAREGVLRRLVDSTRASLGSTYTSTYGAAFEPVVEGAAAEEEAKVSALCSGMSSEEIEATFIEAKAETCRVREVFNKKMSEAAKKLMENAAVRSISVRLLRLQA